jgi:hypothetical protein
MQFKNNVTCDDIDLLLREKQSQAGQDLFVIAMTQGKINGSFLEIGGHHPFEISNTYVLEKMFDWHGWSIDIIDYSLEFNIYEGRIWKNFYNSVRDNSWPPTGTSFASLPEYIQKELIEVHGYNWFVHPYKDVDTGWARVRPKTNFIKQDAVTVDYASMPDHIDYLQIDIDDSSGQLSILNDIVKYKTFTVITFEHEYYQKTTETDNQRREQRKILFESGYELVVNDVAHEDKAVKRKKRNFHTYEDWWVNPKIVSPDIIASYSWIEDVEPKYWEKILFNP